MNRSDVYFYSVFAVGFFLSLQDGNKEAVGLIITSSMAVAAGLVYIYKEIKGEGRK